MYPNVPLGVDMCDPQSIARALRTNRPESASACCLRAEGIATNAGKRLRFDTVAPRLSERDGGPSQKASVLRHDPNGNPQGLSCGKRPRAHYTRKTVSRAQR